MTRKELCEIAHVSKQAVSKAIKESRIIVDKNGDIPEDNDTNLDFIEKALERFENSDKKKLIIEKISGEIEKEEEEVNCGQSNGDTPKRRDLELKKIKADIDLKNMQKKKLELELEIKRRDMIPTSLMTIWIGYFATGIRTYFLPIGNRIARGDTELRDRIEKEVKKAIEKTIETAKRGLIEESEKLAQALEPKGEEE